MTMPNFLLIGAAKSGTDALYSELAQHPRISMCPTKEPNCFVAAGHAAIPSRGPGDRAALERWGSWVSTPERYEGLFAGVSAEHAIGEGSAWYLSDEKAHRRIHRCLPHAKLIAIPRNPVDRACPAFTMLLRDGREPRRDFSRAAAISPARRRCAANSRKSSARTSCGSRNSSAATCRGGSSE